jgi:hypothetical protein
MKHPAYRGSIAPLILLTLLTGNLFAQTAKDKPGKDKQPPQKPADAKPDPAKVAKQKQTGVSHWKRIVEETPQQFEGDHLLVLAPAASKNLPELGAYLEKVYGLAARALKLSTDERWTGKLTVFLVNEPSHFKSFMRSVIRKRAEEDDRGGFQLEGDFPAVVASPPMNALELKTEQEASSQIAQALIRQKAQVKLPDWLTLGFGRATVLRSGTPAVYASEKRKAVVLVLAKKRTSRDVWMGSDALLAGEAAILRGILVDFLAYSGATQKFPELVSGYRPRDNKMPNPTTETAFTRADFNADSLEKAWRAWLAR